MKKYLEIFLGILTAMGGFVEIGELVFSVNGGAKFGYSLMWVVALGTVGIIITGIDPVMVVEYSTIFSVIILPLTFLTLLMAASDKELMGPFLNGRLAKSLGWFYLTLVCLAALAAVPLLVITHGRKE